MTRILVLGLGNPILTDDGIGIYVARAVGERLRRDDVSIAEASVGGLRLLDILAGYDAVIVVDAILTAEGRPGEVRQAQPGELCASLHSGSTHDLSLPGALALGRQIGMALPADKNIIVVTVEAEDVLTFGETCTPAVAEAIPVAAQLISDLVVHYF